MNLFYNAKWHEIIWPSDQGVCLNVVISCLGISLLNYCVTVAFSSVVTWFASSKHSVRFIL